MWVILTQFTFTFVNIVLYLAFYRKSIPKAILSFCVIDFLTSFMWAGYFFDIFNYTLSTYSSWIFNLAEGYFIPKYLCSVMNKKNRPLFLMATLLILPVIQKVFVYNHYHYLALNYLVVGIIITYHCYRYIFHLLNTCVEQATLYNYDIWLFSGILICYAPSIPLEIGLTAQHYVKHFTTIPLDTSWTEQAFLILNTIMHTLFIIPLIWKHQLVRLSISR